MGRKRKRKTSTSKRKKGMSLDVAVLLMILVSILLVVVIYFENGILGEVVTPVLGGTIGFIKYFVPIGFFGLAICMVKEEKTNLWSKVVQYVLFLSCISAIFTIYQVSKGTLNLDLAFDEILKAAYSLGQKSIGGGTIGTVIAYPLIELLGMYGAAVCCIGVAAIFLVFAYGLKPSEWIRGFLERMREREEYYEDEEIEVRPKKAVAKKIKEQNANEKVREKVQSVPAEENIIEENQITINMGKPIEEESKKSKISGFFKNRGEEREEKSEPKKQNNPEVIEANLFKQQEEVKESKTKEVLQLEHAMTMEDEDYEYPPVEILSLGNKKNMKGGAKALTDTAAKLQKTLYSFGGSAKVENVTVGPTITRYELKPAEGVRVSKIANLSDDIALNLAAETIRIEAPIPGKQAVGIEVPNKEKEAVHLRETIESDEFENNKSKLSVALGKDVAGKTVVADIAKMPHVLIAGATGSGKSVCINTIITSIIYNAKPSEVKLVMVDPKVVDLSVYNGIPHLLIPVVTDPKKAAGAFAWAVQEMENRYSLFASKGVRDLKGYNAAIEDGLKMPQIVIIIDELADLMMVAAKDVEDAICRLAQKARAAGMHLVIATQRPSVDVITGLIKANVPSRIAFSVSSQIDSRTILDMVGAEKLLGKGDMLYYPAGATKPMRVQGAFVSDNEVEKIVDFVKSNGEAKYSEDIINSIEKANSSDREKEEMDEDDDTDPFLNEAIETVIDIGQASASFIQRRFKVGYARAGRIIDQMEARGIISGYEGSKPRQVLMSRERWEELKTNIIRNENQE